MYRLVASMKLLALLQTKYSIWYVRCSKEKEISVRLFVIAHMTSTGSRHSKDVGIQKMCALKKMMHSLVVWVCGVFWVLFPCFWEIWDFWVGGSCIFWIISKQKVVRRQMSSLSCKGEYCVLHLCACTEMITITSLLRNTLTSGWWVFLMSHFSNF